MNPDNYIDRLKGKSLPQLKKLATENFNAWIRERDRDLGCISCSTGKVEQAGHYYSGGHHAGLRFNEGNVSGQCVRCNHFLSGNLVEYRKGLIKRHGEGHVLTLDKLKSIFDHSGYKWDRSVLIDIILKYK